MSKFICLSCQKEFKVSVRAPMSCPTKHLCNVVLNERFSGAATATTATPNDQQKIADSLVLPNPITKSTPQPAPAQSPPSQATPAPEEEVSFALHEFVERPATLTPQPPLTFASTKPVGALIIGDQQFPISHSHTLGREGDLGRELFRMDKTVGRTHARVDVTPSQEVAIRNLAHSGNPVIIDGIPLAFNSTTVLKAGLHQIQLGTRFLCSINVLNICKDKA